LNLKLFQQEDREEASVVSVSQLGGESPSASEVTQQGREAGGVGRSRGNGDGEGEGRSSRRRCAVCGDAFTHAASTVQLATEISSANTGGNATDGGGSCARGARQVGGGDGGDFSLDSGVNGGIVLASGRQLIDPHPISGGRVGCPSCGVRAHPSCMAAHFFQLAATVAAAAGLAPLPPRALIPPRGQCPSKGRMSASRPEFVFQGFRLWG
jgi:hypothetical protein